MENLALIMPESIRNKLKSTAIRALYNLGLMDTVDILPSEYRLLAGKKIPLFIDEEFNPCFKLERAPSTHRVFVLTIPKSGTYLITEILEKMGMVNCGVHVALDFVQDNRYADEQILKIEPGRYMVHLPFHLSTKLIQKGQFAFGHIPCYRTQRILLNDFQKVFTYRNIRDVIISLVRYHDSRKHKAFRGERLEQYSRFKAEAMGTGKIKQWYVIWGNEYINLIKSMSSWKEDEEVFKIKFEILMGDDGEEAQISMLRDLAGFVGLEITGEAINKALNASIGSNTVTYSGRRSLHSEWWNDELEELFVSYGYDLLNKDFGYD